VLYCVAAWCGLLQCVAVHERHIHMYKKIHDLIQNRIRLQKFGCLECGTCSSWIFVMNSMQQYDDFWKLFRGRFPNRHFDWGDGEQKRKKTKRIFGTQPKKNFRPGPDGLSASGWYERPRGRFCRYWCSILNYDGNLSLYGTFLIKLLFPPLTPGGHARKHTHTQINKNTYAQKHTHTHT